MCLCFRETNLLASSQTLHLLAPQHVCAHTRFNVTTCLTTPLFFPFAGVKALDVLTPLGRGTSLLVIGSASSGKGSLAEDTVLGQRGAGGRGRRQVRGGAMSCCARLCYAGLGCAVSCHAVLSCTVPCCAAGVNCVLASTTRTSEELAALSGGQHGVTECSLRAMHTHIALGLDQMYCKLCLRLPCGSPLWAMLFWPSECSFYVVPSTHNHYPQTRANKHCLVSALQSG